MTETRQSKVDDEAATAVGTSRAKGVVYLASYGISFPVTPGMIRLGAADRNTIQDGRYSRGRRFAVGSSSGKGEGGWGF